MDSQLSAQELILVTELEQRRRAGDPLRSWSPLPKQQPFVNAVLHGPAFTNWFIAANRAGKSEALASCVAQLARFGTDEKPNQPTTGWVCSLDGNTSRDIIQPKLFDNGFVPPGVTPFIPEREIDEWRVSDQILKLKNKSLIGFKNMESARIKFQGVEKDYIAFDEEPEKDKFEEAVTRVGAGRRLRVFGAVTLLPPEGNVGGVSWLFPDVIQPWLEGHRTLVGLYGSSIYDNPHLPVEELRRLESIYPDGTNQRRIRLGGEWLPGLAGARAYAAFDRRLHVRPQPPIAPRRPLCWIWDFNVEPLITHIGQREQRLFRVLRQFVIDEGSVPEMCDWFRNEIPSHSAEIWIYGDATGRSRSGQTGQSDYQLIMNAMRSYNVPVRMKVPETNPFVKDRLNAVNRAMKNEFGEIWVEVDPSCKELIADFEQVLVDGRGGIKKTHNRRDPYYRRTHASDGVGYWIAYEEPVRSFTAGGMRGGAGVKIPTPGYSYGV
jgi:phage terminase large subunit-like protein